MIHGRGKDKAPAGAFSLFADIHYNVDGERDTILVIPARGTANNFSDYGFDQSDDGVSSVVNNTNDDNILFTRINQRGSQLPVKAGTSIGDMTKLPLEGGRDNSWNDRAQSALAFPRPVPLPVFTAPADGGQSENRRQPVRGTAAPDVQQVMLYEGAEHVATLPVKDSAWEYTPEADWPLGQHSLAALAVRDDVTSGKTSLRFYVTLPSPVVDIRSPRNGTEIDTAASIDGVAFNAESVEVTEGGTKLGSAKVSNHNWAFRHQDGWSVGSHTVTARAVRDGQESAPETVTFTAAKKNLTVDFTFNSSWQDWETKKYIHSYDVTLYAGASDVTHWNVGFGQLPVGAVLFKEFTHAFWGMIVEDGSNGEVLLGSPPEGVHVVPKGGKLNIRVLVLYPTQDEAYKHLYALFAKSLSEH
ncbi:Ig-like domain-containing protein [Streptomyces sp. NPDC052051]|uniref:Ig-like domain-containing protein n=1 Tax=Streptomyces sp. NPDC052051 TaxID=3154649 RepID=UPI0034179FCE